jgi:hypothetical protein
MKFLTKARLQLHRSSLKMAAEPSFVLCAYRTIKTFFLIGVVGVEPNWVHSALRPLIGLLCQPRVIMMIEKLVE